MYPFERFTERAKKVLTLAQEEAERAHHSYIGTEHLLLGLMREREGLAAVALANLGVDIDSVRGTIALVLGRDERIVIKQIVPTSRVKKVIEVAFEESRQRGHNYVGTEHLLLGLLIEGEGIGAHVLEDLGAGLSKVRTEIDRLLSEGKAPSEQPPAPTRGLEPGARVLVHEPEPPHRLWEGRFEGGEGRLYKVSVAGRPAGEEMVVDGLLIHQIPMRGTYSCPYCSQA